MATTGSVDVNLSTIGNTVNNSTYLGEQVTAGIANQGDLIGMAVGLFIALGLIFGVVFLVWKFGKNIISTAKTFHK